MKNYKFTLSPAQEKNLENVVLQNGKPLFPKEKETIFSGNKTFLEVLFEGLIFAIGTATALTIIAGCIIAFINLNY